MGEQCTTQNSRDEATGFRRISSVLFTEGVNGKKVHREQEKNRATGLVLNDVSKLFVRTCPRARREHYTSKTDIRRKYARQSS